MMDVIAMIEQVIFPYCFQDQNPIFILLNKLERKIEKHALVPALAK